MGGILSSKPKRRSRTLEPKASDLVFTREPASAGPSPTPRPTVPTDVAFEVTDFATAETCVFGAHMSVCVAFIPEICSWTTRRVLIYGCQVQAWQWLLQHFYEMKPSLSIENVAGVLHCADQFDVAEVVDMCVAFIVDCMHTRFRDMHPILPQIKAISLKSPNQALDSVLLSNKWLTLEATWIMDFWLRTECDSLFVPTDLMRLLCAFAVSHIGSLILENYNLSERFSEKCGNDLSNNCTLLFRGSEHGFGADEFHRRCDGKGNTLTVALTEFGHVIGGFTTVPWSSQFQFGMEAAEMWLFVARMNELKKHSGLQLPAVLRDQRGSFRVYQHSNIGPTFRGAVELQIASHCNDNALSYCCCRSPFVLGGVALNALAMTGAPRIDLLSRSHFRVVDYEVFWLQSQRSL